MRRIGLSLVSLVLVGSALAGLLIPGTVAQEGTLATGPAVVPI